MSVDAATRSPRVDGIPAAVVICKKFIAVLLSVCAAKDVHRLLVLMYYAPQAKPMPPESRMYPMEIPIIVARSVLPSR